MPRLTAEASNPALNVGIVYEVCRLMYGLFRIIGHEGGTRSGKTYNIVLWLVDAAMMFPGLEITIASRNMPHLKKGAMKDFLQIMTRRKLYRDQAWNMSDKVYTFKNGSYIEFFNADDIGKVSGPSRDILFCNEVNFFKKNVFDQLLRRTRKCCILDYNPIHPKHWLYDKVMNRKDAYLWRSTYLDNLKFLPEEQIREIEFMKENDPLAWHVYGLGLRGVYQKGQIFGQSPCKPWKAITLTEYEKIQSREIFGLDWGFDPDPNALLGVKFVGNKRFIRKYIYCKNQSNDALKKQLKAFKIGSSSPIVADTYDKKSIQELQQKWLVYGAIKGPGSVEQGIKTLQSKEIYYVMDPDLEFEYYNYTYILGPDEESTGVPIDKHNHLIDCLRYVERYKEHL